MKINKGLRLLLFLKIKIMNSTCCPMMFDMQKFISMFHVNFNNILGKGHDSNVFKVYNTSTKEVFALKCLASQQQIQVFNMSCILLLQALRNEIHILRQLSHHQIIQCFGYSSDYSCILLEFMPFGSLFTLLSHTGPLDIKFANSLFLQLLNTVSYLHSNEITHGDLKPENLLISEKFQVKVCDFGFALKVGGSEGYNAPEIFTLSDLDMKKCDIFSLGVVFFVISTACPPFISNNPMKKDAWWDLIAKKQYKKFWRVFNKNGRNIPLEFQEIIEAMMEVDPASRPTIKDLLSNPWLNSIKATDEELTAEIEKRVTKISH